MTTYTLDIPEDNIDDSFELVVSVGSKSITMSFLWDNAAEEQYNELVQACKVESQSDPLKEVGYYNKDYDYIEYWEQFRNMSQQQRLDWCKNPTWAPPASFSGLSPERQVVLIGEHLEDTQEATRRLTVFKECMRWQVKADYEGDIDVAVVQTGGWYRQQNSIYAFRFVSSLDEIGRDDLKTVTIEFEVYDE